MNAPDVSSSDAPGGSHRVTFPTLPTGTIQLTIGRVLAGTHQRGGRREHVARVAPTKLRSSLITLGPGRYRVASLDQNGCFLRGGSFAVEVPAGTLEPVMVPPRVPSDYPRRPSTTSAARRGTQRIMERVQELQTHLREAYAANVQLEHDLAVQREKHLKEALRGHELLETMQEKLERLVIRVNELETQQDTRHRKGREGLAEVREGLANERRQRKADVVRLAAGALTPAEAANSQVKTPPEPVAETLRSAPVHDTRPPIAEVPSTPMREAPPSNDKAAPASGFAALAGVRNTPQQSPVPATQPSAPPSPPLLSVLEAIEAFLKNLPAGSNVR